MFLNVPFLNTKPTVNNIESHLNYLFVLNREFWEKSNEDVMHKHDSVKDAQNCLGVHRKILA